MSFRFLFYKHLIVFLFLPILVSANVNDDVKTDILFLKIQELELEIAELRNRLESQNYLIEKLIAESTDADENDSENLENLTLNADIRFAGIEDPKSKDQIYNAAIEHLKIKTLINHLIYLIILLKVSLMKKKHLCHIFG